MNFLRASKMAVRPGGSLDDSRWDALSALSVTSVVKNGVVYTYYRGLIEKVSDGDEGQVGVMTCPANDFRPENFNWPSQPMLTKATDYYSGEGRWGDMQAVNADGTIYLYAVLKDTEEGLGAQLLLFTGTDPESLTFDQEVIFDGWDAWGRNNRHVYYINDKFYIATNGSSSVTGTLSSARLRSSPNGKTNWTDHGTIAEPTGVDGDYHRYSLIVGRGWNDATHAYLLIPGGGQYSGDDNDWPEAHGLYRCPINELEQQNRTWDFYHRNPVFHRAPNEGACWQLAHRGGGADEIAPYQMWGVHGYNWIGSQLHADSRDQSYVQANDATFKNVMAAKCSSAMALKDWDFDPFPDGQYVIQHVKTGKYLRRGKPGEDNAVSVMQSLDDSDTVWSLSRERLYYTLETSNLLLGIANGSLNIGAEVRMQPVDPPAENTPRQWHLPLVRDEDPGKGSYLVQLINRNSSQGVMVRPNDGFVYQAPVRDEVSSYWRLSKIV